MGTLRIDTRGPTPARNKAGFSLSYQPPLRTRLKVKLTLFLILTAKVLEGTVKLARAEVREEGRSERRETEAK